MFIDIFRFGDSIRYRYDGIMHVIDVVNMFVMYVGVILGVWDFDFILVLWVIWVKFLLKVGIGLGVKDVYEDWIYVVYGICLYLSGVYFLIMLIYLLVRIYGG